MRVVGHQSVEELRRSARTEVKGRVAVRLLAVAWALDKKTAPQIACELGVSRRAVQDWVRWYNDGGVAALRDEGGRGRKPPLNAHEQARLKARLDAGPTPHDRVCTLRGRDVKRILKEEFGKVRSLSSVYVLLHTLGYNDLVPRPQHMNADPEKQALFKKVPRT